MVNQKYMVTRSGKKVIETIRQGQTTDISEDSFKDKRGTSAYFLKDNKDGELRIDGVHDTPDRD